MPRSFAEIFADLRDRVARTRERLALLASEMGPYKTTADGLPGPGAAWTTGLRRLEGGEGEVAAAAGRIRSASRRATGLVHDIEIALSPRFFLNLLGPPGDVPTRSFAQGPNTFLKFGPPDPAVSPVIALRRDPGSPCRAMELDHLGLGLPLRMESGFAQPTDETGLLWGAAGFRAESETVDGQLRHRLRKFVARGERLCDAGALFDSLDVTVYSRQVGCGTDGPITRPPGPGDASVPVCDPTTADCRHLRSLLATEATRRLARSLAVPEDVTAFLQVLTGSDLGFEVALCDLWIDPNVALMARITNQPRRDRVEEPALGPLPEATPAWDLAIKLLKVHLDRLVTARTEVILQAFREEHLEDDQELFATIRTITLNPEENSIDLIVDVEIKSKEDFSFDTTDSIGLPISVTVTMRVSLFRTLLIRGRFETEGGSLSLRVRQEAVLSESEDVDFSPDIVDVLLDSMKDFIGALGQLLVTLEGSIDEEVDLIEDSSIAAIGPVVEPGRLILFVRMA